MDEDSRYHAATRRILIGWGLLMGGAYGLMLILLRPAMEAAEALPLSRDSAGPYVLFLLVAGALGWATSWVSDYRGVMSVVPALAVGAFALLVGLGIGAVSGGSLLNTTKIALFLAAFGFAAAALLRQKLES
ncbi:MAG: hypothetical protein GY778_24825 [bacterium]|nr:hypothetical protein [bacterium]